ncbi:MAG TPA: hypothetical protein PLA74_09380 [Syntrophales bacterium]|nr:hypothetical protein [Syntrophales bacterium]HPQ45280.1 hypothetical protein [Syntrophales bacterium]
MNNKVKVSVGILLVFVLGVLAGSFGTKAYMKYRFSHFMQRGHEARTEFLLGQLSRDLDLTEDQRTEIRKILTDSHQRLNQISRRCQPEIRGIIEHDFEMIRELLNDEQKPKFDQFQKQFHKKGKQRAFQPPLPPPPHRSPPM